MKRRAAAFTLVRNESFWLRAWASYYCSCFPQEDVYILDNSSTDNSVVELRSLWPHVHIDTAEHKQDFDADWMRKTVEKKQGELLGSYEVVLFSEADEFLIPDLGVHSSIYEYCSKLATGDIPQPNMPARRARGLGAVHQVGTEPPFDGSTPLLLNRSTMHDLPRYSKTLVTKVPLRYRNGFHYTYSKSGVAEQKKPIDPQLSMLHMLHFDIDVFSQRCIDREAQFGAQANKAWQGYHPDRSVLEGYFRTLWQHSPIYETPKLEIPDRWKTLLSR